VLKAREYALKTIANSIYGYLGFYLARWYCRECVQSISSYGRYYITSLIEKAGSQGYEVLYSDTDSVFLSLNEKTPDEALSFMGLFNMELPEQMELEYHGFYPRGIFVSTRIGETGAKKRYALLSEDKSLVIKGFETVRRNTSLIARKTQQRLLEIILKENNPSRALAFVKSVITRIIERKIGIKEMIIFTQLQKKIEDYESIGPHVAIARRLQERGNQIGPGSVIVYVICGAGELVRDRAKLPEECTIEDYDVDYYINNQLLPSVDKILEVIGYSKEDILTDADQKRLDKFFS
jgi:DNA polymerase I